MKYQYEFIEYTEGLPLKAFVHSVNAYAYHWHKEMEIILVLKGSVEIRVGGELNTLTENDLILLNCDEVHSTNSTGEDNILLVLQISPEYFSEYYPDLKRMSFACKSIKGQTATNGVFDAIRQKLADVVWSINKRNEGYSLEIMGHVHQILAHLVMNFDYKVIDEKNMELHEKDLTRLKRITDYVNENYQEKITLTDMAKREYLSFYYLSHFIKDKMGISFQTYLTEVRLENAVHLLQTTNKTISEIVFETGFPNTKSFNKAFKQKYRMTPSAYRKDLDSNRSKVDVLLSDQDARYYLDFDRGTALRKILQYRSDSGSHQPGSEADSDSGGRVASRKIEISGWEDSGQEPSSASKALHHKTWKRLMTFGRAAEALRAEFRDQLKMIQRDVGFEYARFHGIFSDEMMVVRLDGRGEKIYNWVYVDELVDTLLENKLKPFFELGFMPTIFRRDDKTIFEWKGNISPPSDMNDWKALVQAFVLHLINRYGIEEVLSWRFEVWNEPDLQDFFWTGTQEDYFELYKVTAEALKSIHKNLQVGGPTVVYVSLFNSDFAENFLKFCKVNKVPLDFFTYHVYYEKMPTSKDTLTFMERFEKITERQNNHYHESDHLLNCIEAYDELLRTHYGKQVPVYITEWNSSAFSRNLIHDTCFKAPYIIENAMCSDGKIGGLGYWVFTDLFEEWGAGPTEFHGGFGLITRSGIPKPGYFAYKLLNKLGDRLIDKGEGYVVTAKGDDIQVLVWNFAYYDTLFKTGDESALSQIRRYDVFEDKADLHLDVNIEMRPGRYSMTRTNINRISGSGFDSWTRMGAPEDMNQDDLEYLKKVTVPDRKVSLHEVESALVLSVRVPVHGVELLEIKKTYK